LRLPDDRFENAFEYPILCCRSPRNWPPAALQWFRKALTIARERAKDLHNQQAQADLKMLQEQIEQLERTQPDQPPEGRSGWAQSPKPFSRPNGGNGDAQGRAS